MPPREGEKQARCLLGPYNGATFNVTRGAAMRQESPAEHHARNSPSGIMRRPPGFILRAAAFLGFNLNKIRYLLVATFNSSRRHP